jgi:hypothetical protein
MTEKPRKSWKRRIRSCLLCLSVGWAIYIVSMNLIVWHFAKETSEEAKNLNVLPTPLLDTSVAELKGLRIEKFGFSFQVPWNDVNRDSTATTGAAIFFKDGAGLLLFDPSSGVNAVEILKGNTTGQTELMTKVLGSQALSSNYELMAAEVLATPADVKWWVGRVRNTRNITLLMNKGMNLGDANTIHRISGKDVRGFQYGDPGLAPFLVRLSLFDTLDRQDEIVISGKDVHRPVISQAQINGMVASFVPMPSPVSSSSPSNGD